MGDRGNISIQHGQDHPVVFYTHWRGSEVAQIVAEGLALAKRYGRLNDPQYATRILFNVLQGDDRSELGFGIGTQIAGDCEYPVPHIIWSRVGKEPEIEYLGGTFCAEGFIETFSPVTQ